MDGVEEIMHKFACKICKKNSRAKTTGTKICSEKCRKENVRRIAAEYYKDPKNYKRHLEMMRRYHRQSQALTKAQSTERKKRKKTYDKERSKDPHRVMVVRKAQQKYYKNNKSKIAEKARVSKKNTKPLRIDRKTIQQIDEFLKTGPVKKTSIKTRQQVIQNGVDMFINKF